MRAKPAAHLALGFVIGAAYWVASPALFGRYEPWDHSIWLHWAVMAAAGLVLGFVAGKHCWVGIVGLCVGQCLVAFVRPQPNSMETVPLHFMPLIMAVHASPSLLAALAGWGIRAAAARTGQTVVGPCGSEEHCDPG
jgi:hypothetical protein